MHFIYIWLILAAIVWFTRQTKLGRKMVRQYTPWTTQEITIGLLVVGIIAFVISDPIANAIITGTAIISYWVLKNANFWAEKESNVNAEHFVKNDKGVQISISYTLKESTQQLTTHHNINKILYSSPYVATRTKPNILFDGNAYQLQLTLVSETYVSSLLQHLSAAGITITKTIKS